MQSNKKRDYVTPVAVKKQQMVFSNKVYLSAKSPFQAASNKYIALKGYILTFQLSNQIEQGKIGVNKKFRQFLSLSLVDKVLIQSYDPKVDNPAISLHFQIQMVFPPESKILIDDVSIGTYFRQKYNQYYVADGQVFLIEYQKVPYMLTAHKSVSDKGFGYISKNTQITIQANRTQKLRLASEKSVQKTFFQSDFKFEQLGIGGLDKQLANIFRRVFATRRLPSDIIDKMGIKHVKGFLLFGPPGTGKTLIARQLAHSLKAKSFQVVNGPQIFSKYVGESEQNIRKLFIQAREDQKKYADESGIHVIVFDQIDALCRQRGSDTSGTSAKDAVVNQILTNLDGVEALNNIIVIGMTNRKDLIDDAVLRPGRLQVHIQIGIPDQDGRVQIYEIHTRTIKQNKLLGSDVSIQQLARISKNYTGAEIEAVVKNASSYALLKGNDITDFTKQFTLKKESKVVMSDFLKALQEIKPAFGIDEEYFDIYARQKLVNYGKRYEKIIQKLQRIKKLILNGQNRVVSILLYGETGTGKTSLASTFSRQSNFPYVKLISPQQFLKVMVSGKIYQINKIFTDSYKSKQSIVVIDNVERLIQFVQMSGKIDFNNRVLQQIEILLHRIPTNPQSRLLIIATSSNIDALRSLRIDQYFTFQQQIPKLNSQEIKEILNKKTSNFKFGDTPIKHIMQFQQLIKNKEHLQMSLEQLWKKFHSSQYKEK